MNAAIVGVLAAGAVLQVGLSAARGRRLGDLVPVAVSDERASSGSLLGVAAQLRGRVHRRLSRRVDVVQGHLADAASAIASASRAGLGLTHAIDLAADQTGGPVGDALRDVVDRSRLGAPLDEALDVLVSAVPSPDARLLAAVLRLHRRTGGALAPVLEGVARTLRERRASVREVRSLTAQARLSGAILGLLPLGFFLFLVLTSRRDMISALGTSLGRTAIVVGLLLETAAFLSIRRLLQVER